MKQLLLRVPDDVHRRIKARAARERRSVNSLATELLDRAADAEAPGRQERGVARAKELGIYRPAPRPEVAPSLEAAYESLRGAGPDVIDELERGREAR